MFDVTELSQKLASASKEGVRPADSHRQARIADSASVPVDANCNCKMVVSQWLT